MKSYFTLFLLMLGITVQAQFTPNNLAVLKISGTAIGNTGVSYQTNIVELTTAGAATGTNINLTGGSPSFVVEERPAAHEGQIHLTGDRNYITAVGYENTIGQAFGVLRGGPKRVARISSSGVVDLSTNIQGGATFNFNGVSVRSAVSMDGSSYIINSGSVGSSQGIRQIDHGVTNTSPQYADIVTRSLLISGGVVYSSSQGGLTINAYSANGAPPPLAVATPLTLTGLTGTNDCDQFVFLDSNNDGTDDVLYIANRNSGIHKMYLSGGSWVAVNATSGLYNPTIGGSGGFYALTGRMEGGKPTLYGIKIIASGTSSLVRIQDNRANSIDWNSTGNFPNAIELASTTNAEQFKGVCFTPGSAVVVPIELMSFKGSLIQDKAALQWATASERNAKEFIVEKSTDAKEFAAIGTVAAKNSSNVTNYSFDDTKLSENVHYYRLKMVDTDGSFKYSNVVALRLGSKSSKGISVFPNPVANNMTINHIEATEGATISIVSINGSTVAQYNVAKNAIQTSLDVTQLVAGQYFIKFTDKGKSITTSFIK